jgi:luciferase family oxidoreductase group 1
MLAASKGLPFAFASHFAPQYLYAASELYRRNFRPSATLSQPHLMIGVPIIAAETDAAAQRLFTSPQQRFLRLIRNQPVESLPPVAPEEMDQLWNPAERDAVEARLGAAIVGSEATIKSGLERLIRDTHADEVIAVTDTWDHKDRLDSYARVAAVAQTIQSTTLASA